MALDRSGYELDFEDTFDSPELDARWLPYYLPHWSSRAATATRYRTGDGRLRLLTEEDQPPWCPEFDGRIKTSTLQTGLYAGPLGSSVGQLRFRPDLVVREEQENVRLYTPRYGLFEIRCQAIDDPRTMVALWMIGYEDEPHRSAEICICEIFGRDIRPDRAAVGMGLHPFGDPGITEEFKAEEIAIDAREFHVYAAEWTSEVVRFFVDDQLVKTVHQSPDYPMQFMLSVYEFPAEDGGASYPTARKEDGGASYPTAREEDGGASYPTAREEDGGASYPKEFVVDWFRAYRPV
jgi:hypothetical protein